MFAFLLPVSNAIRELDASSPPMVASQRSTLGRKRGVLSARAAPRANTGSPATDVRVVVNPLIVAKSEAAELGLEGCLSIPEHTALIRRHTCIDVRYQDIEGKLYYQRLTGLELSAAFSLRVVST